MQQMLCSAGTWKNFAIGVLRLLFHCYVSRNSAAAPEGAFTLRQPTNPEAIDADGLDDHFFVPFTEDVRVDQPRRWTAAH
jgi:hypothetical protein